MKHPSFALFFPTFRGSASSDLGTYQHGESFTSTEYGATAYLS